MIVCRESCWFVTQANAKIKCKQCDKICVAVRQKALTLVKTINCRWITTENRQKKNTNWTKSLEWLFAFWFALSCSDVYHMLICCCTIIQIAMNLGHFASLLLLVWPNIAYHLSTHTHTHHKNDYCLLNSQQSQNERMLRHIIFYSARLQQLQFVAVVAFFGVYTRTIKITINRKLKRDSVALSLEHCFSIFSIFLPLVTLFLLLYYIAALVLFVVHARDHSHHLFDSVLCK